MSDILPHIIETLKSISLEHKDADEIFETLNFIINLLDNCDPKRLTKAHISRTFNIKRLTIDVRYGGK